MGRTAIIEPVIAQLVEEGRELVRALREAETTAQQLEQKLTTTREAAQARRIELGLQLIRARDRLPKRGTREHGWGAYLEAIEVDEATAWRYMKLAGGSGDAAVFQEGPLKDSGPDTREIPPPNDADVPPEVDGEAPQDHAAPEGVAAEPDSDRNAWCTPRWIAEALGDFDLDPCTNERSHIRAAHACMVERGDDGLCLNGNPGDFFTRAGGPATAETDWRVYINPPYERGAVQRFVAHYKHTRFTFLLRLDPSTDWFDELYAATAVILIPKGDRVEFEPPPGVEASKNPFPHGLFFARAADVPEALLDRCYVWRVETAA